MDNFKYLITSKRRLIDLHLKETFQYRDLIYLFVKRDFISTYKQTILGPLWAIIQPLFTTIVFTVVFGNMAKLTTADVEGDFAVPGVLFYLSGCICWSFFSSILNATSYTFIGNQSTMGKVYYPRLVVPIATAFSQLISFAIQLAMFLALWLYYLLQGGYELHVTSALITVPIQTLHIMLLSIGCGIIISSVTTKYRDLMKIVAFGIQLWQYVSPIAYGLELVPKAALRWYMMNPVTPIVTTFRYSIFGFGYFNWFYYAVSWLISLTIFFIGITLFSKVERTFIDTV